MLISFLGRVTQVRMPVFLQVQINYEFPSSVLSSANKIFQFPAFLKVRIFTIT